MKEFSKGLTQTFLNVRFKSRPEPGSSELYAIFTYFKDQGRISNSWQSFMETPFAKKSAVKISFPPANREGQVERPRDGPHHE